MPDFVRVEHTNGNQFTVVRVVADADSDLKIIDEPAVDASGMPLEPTYPKPRVPLGAKNPPKE